MVETDSRFGRLQADSDAANAPDRTQRHFKQGRYRGVDGGAARPPSSSKHRRPIEWLASQPAGGVAPRIPPSPAQAMQNGRRVPELELMSVRLEPALDVVDPEMRISAAVPAFDMTFPPRCLLGLLPFGLSRARISPRSSSRRKIFRRVTPDRAGSRRSRRLRQGRMMRSAGAIHRHGAAVLI